MIVDVGNSNSLIFLDDLAVINSQYHLFFYFLDCGNEVISGSYKEDGELDRIEQIILISSSPKSCTEFNIPFEKDEVHSKTHFAKMWYDLIIDSPSFLNLVQGESDPYTYTIGRGCGYTLTGERFAYSNKKESAILKASSENLYYIDEGESIGALDKNILIGNTMPPVGEYSSENPLTSVGSMQNIYISLSPKEIVKRVEVSFHFLKSKKKICRHLVNILLYCPSIFRIVIDRVAL